MNRAAILLALICAGCVKITLEVTHDAVIEGKPATCHRAEGARQWTCDPK